MNTRYDLPDATSLMPTCGVCWEETDFTDDAYECSACGLKFDSKTLKASYIDYDAEPCERECDNVRHNHDKSNPPGRCILPSGHRSIEHYENCRWGNSMTNYRLTWVPGRGRFGDLHSWKNSPRDAWAYGYLQEPRPGDGAKVMSFSRNAKGLRVIWMLTPPLLERAVISQATSWDKANG